VASQETIKFEDLPLSIQSSKVSLFKEGIPEVDAFESGDRLIKIPLGTSLKEVESLLIRKTLEATQGDKEQTAKLLGINSRTIYRKLKEEET
jgi:DNA-binding NtrC family response regulator